jgi:hypothetical protein
MNKKMIIIATVVLIIFIGLGAFSNSYKDLENSIDDERVQYIGEIERQLVSRSVEIRDDISSSLYFLSVLLKHDKPSSFEDAKLNFTKITNTNKSIFILVTENGVCYNVSGEIFELQNKALLTTLIIDNKPVSSFERLITGQNYLITAQPESPISGF